MKNKKQFRTQNYDQQMDIWPTSGKHIMAQYDDYCIVLYQAFNSKIASWVVENQRFGGPDYSTTRMTWFKSNFLWMMYRSGWCSKSNQEHVLAIWITRDSFEKALLQHYLRDLNEKEKERGKIRLQWDPDHRPNGENCINRKALQIGLKGDILFGLDVVEIQDISQFCLDQYEKNVKGCKNWKNLDVPEEREYFVKDTKLMKHLLSIEQEK
jgi:hypothetical protein